MSRLIDPIHFFNARGMSILTQAHLEGRIEDLTKANEQLTRQRDAAVSRLREISEEPDVTIEAK